MRKLVAVLVLALAALPAMAYAPSNVKLSLWGPMAIAAPGNNIDEISGLDLGIGSDAESVMGVQVDLVYANTQRALSGVQWAFLFSQATELTGWQSGLLTHSTDMTGLQTGFVNFNDHRLTGVQWSAVNFADSFTGAQVGFVNFAQEANGLQFGFVNFTERIDGIQIGIINFAKNGFVPVMVLINGNF